MEDFKVEDEDLYLILGIQPESTTNDIKKAYRKKALECHPDKNLDNPNAAYEFHKLSKVLEVLTDESARKAYDRVLKARKEAVLRHNELDSKRKKFKEDLEAKEKLRSSHVRQKNADVLLKEEIERLRKESSKQVEEEVEYVMRQIRKEMNKKNDTWDSSKHRIRIKWKTSKQDSTDGGYTQEMLHKFLSKVTTFSFPWPTFIKNLFGHMYGDIVVLVMSPKKKGSALVEFSTKRAAEMAVSLEKGLASNPLILSWLTAAPTSGQHQSNTIKDTDFESLTLMKLRQAEERKRLIEKMMAEDNAT